MGKLVALDKASDFVGRLALRREQARGGPARRLVGVQLDWNGIERSFSTQRPATGDLRLDRPVRRAGLRAARRPPGRQAHEPRLEPDPEAGDRARVGLARIRGGRLEARRRVDGRGPPGPRRRDGRADALPRPAAEAGLTAASMAGTRALLAIALALAAGLALALHRLAAGLRRHRGHRGRAGDRRASLAVLVDGSARPLRVAMLAVLVGIWIPIIEIAPPGTYGPFVALVFAAAGAVAGWSRRARCDLPVAEVVGLDHVQIAIRPAARTRRARFYGDAARADGGAQAGGPRRPRRMLVRWRPGLALHLGSTRPTSGPARKAHVALVVDDLAAAACRASTPPASRRVDDDSAARRSAASTPGTRSATGSSSSTARRRPRRSSPVPHTVARCAVPAGSLPAEPPLRLSRSRRSRSVLPAMALAATTSGPRRRSPRVTYKMPARRPRRMSRARTEWATWTAVDQAGVRPGDEPPYARSDERDDPADGPRRGDAEAG